MATASLMPPTLEKVRGVVQEVCQSRPVSRVEAFGSLVRGTSRPGSDVDLLVEFLPSAKIGLLEMGALKEDLEERLGCRVDLLSRRTVEKSRNAIRRQAILSALVLLYPR